MRSTLADDMWLVGQKYWLNGGYSIGIHVLGMCLNISTVGSVKAPYKILTPLSYTNKLIAFGATEITLEDNVNITGVSDMVGHVFIGGTLFKPLVSVTVVTNGKTFSNSELLDGIMQIAGTGNHNFMLPTGTIVYSGITSLLTTFVNKSFEWSIINIGYVTCTLSAATAHTIVGSAIIVSNTSGRFITRVSAVNVAITYRIA